MSLASTRVLEPAAALAILLVAVAAAWFSLVRPLLHWRADNKAAIGDARSELQRLRSVVMLGSHSGEKGQGARLESLRAGFLSGPDDAMVIADLQTRLRAIIVDRKCELIRAHALPAKIVDQQAFFGLRLQIRGHMRQVHAVLYAIETETPFLFVDRVELRLWEYADAGGAPEEDVAAQMVGELDIYGARWPNDGLARD